MQRASGVIWLFGLSAGALLLGFALCFPFFSYLPLYWGIGLAGVFTLTFVACVAFKCRDVPIAYAVVGFAFSALFAWVVFTFTGVERLEEYDCGWKIESGRVKIDLSPIGGFGPSLVSPDALLELLRNNLPATVHLEVPITRDFGRVRARAPIKRVNGILVREY
jgi:hypothetical protein